MNYLADLPKATLSTPEGLWSRIAYQTDAKHENHIGITCHAPRNVGCRDQSAEAFANEVLNRWESYKQGRKGKVGKRTSNIFHELIYSTSENSKLGPEQREALESALLAQFPGQPCRLAWHEDPASERWDLHLLFAYHNDDHPARVFISSNFGLNRPSLSYALYLAEETATHAINATRPEHASPLKTPAQVNRERQEPKKKQVKLHPAAAILNLIPKWDGTPETLPAMAKKAGVQVTRHNHAFISLVIPGHTKATRLTWAELALARDSQKAASDELNETVG